MSANFLDAANDVMMLTRWCVWCPWVVFLISVDLVAAVTSCNQANRCQSNPASCLLSGPTGLQCSVSNYDKDIGDTVADSLLWPGAPSNLSVSVYTITQQNQCVPALNITWQPPQDIGVNGVTGFQLTMIFLGPNSANTQNRWRFNVTWPETDQLLQRVKTWFVFDCQVVSWGNKLSLELYSLPKPNSAVDNRINLNVNVPSSSQDGCCWTGWSPGLTVTSTLNMPISVTFQLYSQAVSYQLQLVTNNVVLYTINTATASALFTNVCAGVYNVTLRAVGSPQQEPCLKNTTSVYCKIYYSLSPIKVGGKVPCPTTAAPEEPDQQGSGTATVSTVDRTVSVSQPPFVKSYYSPPIGAATQTNTDHQTTGAVVMQETSPQLTVIAVVVVGCVTAVCVVAIVVTRLRRRPKPHNENESPPSEVSTKFPCINLSCPVHTELAIDRGRHLCGGIVYPPRELDTTSMNSICTCDSTERRLADCS